MCIKELNEQACLEGLPQLTIDEGLRCPDNGQPGQWKPVSEPITRAYHRVFDGAAHSPATLNGGSRR